MEPPPSVPQGRQVETTFGDSAYQFAKGVTNGVAAESHKIYEDTKALPQRLFTTGKQVVEDVERGRPLRALSPLRAVAHAVRKASLDDVDRIAQATIEGAKEWWAKPPYEKGEEVGRVASFLSKDVVLVVDLLLRSWAEKQEKRSRSTFLNSISGSLFAASGDWV